MNFLISSANYHSEADTLCFLSSVNENARKHQHHKITVQIFDNSGTLDLLNTNYSEIKVFLVKPNRNLGLAPTWKISMSTVRKNIEYDALILVNNDTEFDDVFFNKIAEEVEKDKNCIYGPCIYLPDNSVWSTGGDFGIFPWIVKHYAINDIKSHEARIKTNHLSGCCLIIPRHIIDANDKNFIGLSDFFFRGEEWFFNRVCTDIGIKRILLRDAILVHKENGSHDRFSRAHIYWAVRAKMLFIRKLRTFERVFSFITYGLHLCTKGAFFYKKNSDLSFFNIYKIIISAFGVGMKRRVIREKDFRNNI